MDIDVLVEGDNLVFAAREGKNTISTIYLAPRMVNDGANVCEIKNAATNVHRRREGFMDTLLKEAFECLQSERDPYTFLQTRNPEYFDKYGFETIFEDGTSVMARIVDVKAMFSLFRNIKEFVLAVRIKDDMLYENEGIYLLHCGPMGGRVTAVKIANPDMVNTEGERITAECETDVRKLCLFVFGCIKAEDCFKVYVKSKAEEVYKSLNKLTKVMKPYVCVEMTEEDKKRLGIIK